jgi:hypothetical protein
MISDLDAVLLREEAEEDWKQDVGTAEMMCHERYEPAETGAVFCVLTTLTLTCCQVCC